MNFNSYTFFIFFAIVLAFHYTPFSWKTKKTNLLIASYIFYAAWNPPFVVLLIICTLTDWFAGKGVASSEVKSKRIFFLTIALFVNLGMLIYFKYANFILDNFVNLLTLIKIQYSPPKLNLVLPIGISFFTFQSLTYTFDIYRRENSPWPSFLDFALFVSFFPKVINGPITRAFNFLPQCENQPKADTNKIAMGMFLLLLGLLEKIVIADGLLAPVADLLFNESGVPNMISAWTGTLAFTGQIFFDFAGYSTSAIGVALCLGFDLPQNFKYPYAAIGFSDFWRRWHITLSEWLRDYIYISMGGNRKGTIRTYINILFTMLLCGLWHGASWTFVAWGGLHGLYQVIERFLRNTVPESQIWKKQAVQFLFAIITFLAVSFAWIFFRACSFLQAFSIIKAMVIPNPGVFTVTIESYFIILTFGMTFIVLISHWIMRERSLYYIVNEMPWWLRSAIITIMLFVIITCSGEDRAFIYFQF